MLRENFIVQLYERKKMSYSYITLWKKENRRETRGIIENVYEGYTTKIKHYL